MDTKDLSLPVESVTSDTPSSPKKARKKKPAVTKKRKRAAASEDVKSASAAPPTQILVLDNGGDTIKYGWSTDETDNSPQFMPNVTARLPQQWSVLVGDEIDKIQNPTPLIATRSTERGVITNFGSQIQVWKRILDKLNVAVPLKTDTAEAFGWKAARQASPTATAASKKIAPSSCAVLLLVPPCTPRLVLEQICQCWYDDFGFGHVGIQLANAVAAESTTYETACVVDMGWSACQVVSLHRGKPIASRRLPLGGRHMLQVWKYLASYRQINLMDHDFVMRQIWEQAAEVGLDIQKDLEIGEKLPYGGRPYDAEFLLPDFKTTRQGKLSRLGSATLAEGDQVEEEDETSENARESENDEPSDEEEETIEQRRARLVRRREQEQRRLRAAAEEPQILRICAERRTIPEGLFQPSILSLPVDWASLPETIVQTISASPSHFHAALYRTIQVVGGLSQLTNLEARLQRELRALAPCEYEVNVDISSRPLTQSWHGACLVARKTPFTEWTIPRTRIMKKELNSIWDQRFL